MTKIKIFCQLVVIVCISFVIIGCGGFDSKSSAFDFFDVVPVTVPPPPQSPICGSLTGGSHFCSGVGCIPNHIACCFDSLGEFVGACNSDEPVCCPAGFCTSDFDLCPDVIICPEHRPQPCGPICIEENDTCCPDDIDTNSLSCPESSPICCPVGNIDICVVNSPDECCDRIICD